MELNGAKVSKKKAFGSQRELMGATETKEGHWETYCAIGAIRNHGEPQGAMGSPSELWGTLLSHKDL